MHTHIYVFIYIYMYIHIYIYIHTHIYTYIGMRETRTGLVPAAISLKFSELCSTVVYNSKCCSRHTFEKCLISHILLGLVPVATSTNFSQFCSTVILHSMVWLVLVGSFKLWVSYAEYRLFCRALLQKRPIMFISLLIVATT